MKTTGSLLLLALALAGCGKGGDSGGDDGDTGATGLLFVEDFSGPFPIPDWVITNPGALGSATIDSSSGSPLPSLLIAQPGAPTGNLSVTTKATFASPSLTVSAQMALGGAAGLGTAAIIISDPLTPATTASVVYDAATSTITFNITGTASAPVADPGGFPAFTFSVDGAGTATWTVNNGAVPVMTKAGFPGGNLTVALNNSSNRNFRFDNVRVSAP